MKQDEIFQFIIDERVRQGMKREDLDALSGNRAYGSLQELLRGKGSTTGIKYVIDLLDVLQHKLVIEDENSNWSPRMEQVRHLPKKLFLTERREAREYVHRDGFQPRVDLYDNVETATKFAVTPCDLYEIDVKYLYRDCIDIEEHPYGKMYHYNEYTISPDSIISMVTLL